MIMARFRLHVESFGRSVPRDQHTYFMIYNSYQLYGLIVQSFAMLFYLYGTFSVLHKTIILMDALQTAFVHASLMYFVRLNGRVGGLSLTKPTLSL